MKYKFKSNIDKKEFDNFTSKSNILSFMQEYGWGSVKNTWESFHTGLYKDDKLVATALVLERKLPLGIKMMYIPRGMLIDYKDKELLNAFTEELKKFAKEKKAYMLKIDPNFCYKEYSIKEKEDNEKVNIPLNYSVDYEIKHNNLLECGYKFKGFSKDISESFQPRYHMYIPLVDNNNNLLSEQDVKTSFKKRIRSYLGAYHEKRGVTYFYTQDKKYLDMYMEVINQTEKRQNISLRNKEYFERMMDAYKDEAYLFFGMLDLEKYLSYLEENNKESSDIEMLKDLINKGTKEMALSTSFVIIPENDGLRTSEYLYAGNHSLFNKLNVSCGLVYEICKLSLEKGCSYCNLGGINGSFEDKLTPFKSRFNSIVFEFAGEYDLVINKSLYSVLEVSMPVLRKLHRLIRKK